MKLPGILVFRWVAMPNPEHAHAKLLAFREDDDIATVYVGNATFHAHLAEAIKEEVGSATLLAAGNVDRDASVTSWKSSGFSFETPEEVRGIVSELLRQHSGEVRDAWAK